MARYTVKTPDGQSLDIDGPDGATDEQLIAVAQQELARQLPGKKYDRPVVNHAPPAAGVKQTDPAVLSGLALREKTSGAPGIRDIINHGALFGLSDEVSGVGGALMNTLVAPFSSKEDFDPARAYRLERDIERARLEQAHAAAPVLGSVGEIVGGFAGGRPTAAVAEIPNVLAAIRSGAKGGAVMGGAAGFGNGEGLEQSAVMGGLGAGFGGALGAVIPAVISAGHSALGGISRFLGRDQPGLARDIAGQALIADANTGASAGASMDAARTLGVPRMLADTGENSRALLASIGRQPGPARTIVRESVIPRQEAQGDRVRDAISRDLGPIANTFDAAEALMSGARERAGPLYEAAYAMPAQTSEELQSLLNTPTGRQALQRAYRIAADERRNPATLGLEIDDAGNVRLNPAPAAEQESVANARAALDQAQAEYRTARSTAGGDVEAARAKLEQARDSLRSTTEALSGAPTEGGAAEVASPTVQTLDYVKRGIDDVLNDKRSPLTGRLVLDEAGRAVEGVRRQFVSEVDRLHPGPYAEARSVYAGPAAAREALEKGEDALTASADEIGQMTRDMSPFELSHFGLGFRKAMANMLESKVDGADKVGALLGTPKKREALASVFGGDADLERFLATMHAERDANETYRAVATGSQTASRLADDAQNTDAGLVETATDAAIRGGQSGGFGGAALSLLDLARRTNRYGAGDAGNRVRESVASLLTELDPATIAQIIEDSNRALQIRGGRERALVGSSAIAGRQLGGATVNVLANVGQ